MAAAAVAFAFRTTLMAAQGDPAGTLKRALVSAHKAVQELVDQRGAVGEVCAVAAVIVGDQMWIAHAGDARAWRIRGAKVEPVTPTHRRLQALTDESLDDAERLQLQQDAMRLTHVLGGSEEPDVVVGGPISLRAEDRLVLCTRGLLSAQEYDVLAAMDWRIPARVADELIRRSDARRTGAHAILVFGTDLDEDDLAWEADDDASVTSATALTTDNGPVVAAPAAAPARRPWIPFAAGASVLVAVAAAAMLMVGDGPEVQAPAEEAPKEAALVAAPVVPEPVEAEPVEEAAPEVLTPEETVVDPDAPAWLSWLSADSFWNPDLPRPPRRALASMGLDDGALGRSAAANEVSRKVGAGDCRGAYERSKVGVAESTAFAPLMRTTWGCFNARHSVPLSRVDAETYDDFLVELGHFQGGAQGETETPWIAEPTDGIEFRLQEFETRDGPRGLREIAVSLLGARVVADDLVRDVMLEATAAWALVRSPEAGPAHHAHAARRLYVASRAMQGPTGLLIRAQRPLAAAQLDELLLAIAGDASAPAPEVVQAAWLASTVEGEAETQEVVAAPAIRRSVNPKPEARAARTTAATPARTGAIQVYSRAKDREGLDVKVHTPDE